MYQAEQLMAEDSLLKEYVTDKQEEVKKIKADYEALMKVINKKKWKLDNNLKLDMIRDLASASGLSQTAKATLQKRAFLELLKKKQQAKQPVSLKYVVNRVTSVDWSVLDLFYHLKLNNLVFFFICQDSFIIFPSSK